jgi:hypothetical protein
MNLFVATYPFFHRGAQLLVVAQATILHQKKGRLPSYTCMLIGMLLSCLVKSESIFFVVQ